AQIQIEQTKAGLEKIGLCVEPLRWWDAGQAGDVLHHFGRFDTDLMRKAQDKGMKVVTSDLLTQQGSRSTARLAVQKLVAQAMRTTFPDILLRLFNWGPYLLADACIALTPWEARLMADLFGAPR